MFHNQSMLAEEDMVDMIADMTVDLNMALTIHTAVDMEITVVDMEITAVPLATPVFPAVDTLILIVLSIRFIIFNRSRYTKLPLFITFFCFI